MKQQVRSLIFLILAMVGILAMTGCATSGPAYTKVENIPEGKGLIYIYRPSSFKGGGVFYDVYAKDKVVTTLKNGGYFPYFADLGENEIWAKTEAKSSVTVDVKAGKTYFVKGGVRMGLLIGRPDLSLVTPDIGASEITECNLLVTEKSEK